MGLGRQADLVKVALLLTHPTFGSLLELACVAEVCVRTADITFAAAPVLRFTPL